VRILLVGAGGVGAAFVAIAARRAFFDACVVADYDLVRAERAAAAVDDARFTASQVDASDAGAVERLVREHGATHVMNAVDPRFVMPIFEGALASGADYLDMAMSLSRPHPEHPYASTGVKLGDEQFARAAEWEGAGAWPWSASGWSRDCPTSSPATPLTTCSARSTSSARATAPT
jgi:saccharopine dehydrogenase-like NADP-dependent oxidoreductase